ncbi:MAG: MFS transporter [Verrucomicrobia bacterium]|nr:MFS transporter [Verrucomicrobiota bacterium]
MSSHASTDSPGISNSDRRALFWACFTAIAATAAVFAVRGQVIGDWAREFGLTETQKGELLGVGLWPFAASIVGVSLVADRIGYGRCMFFAFVCHVASTIMLLCAKGYWGLYAGTFLVSIGSGAAQAIADPVVASMYRHNKTTWLNILHASWPAGMVAGGIAGIALGVGGGLDWRWRIGMLLVPMLLYGVLMLGHRFPVHERIEAGVSDKDMFRETGAIGLFLVLVFLFGEFGRLLGLPWFAGVLAAAVCAGAFGIFTRSLGQPMFLFLLVLMIPLATTELGTDSWITSLMEGPMKAMSLNAGWVLIYTSLIMMILRFSAAPVVKLLTPLGVLIASCVLASAGLLALSRATGLTILAAATLYGVGKTYFWPTMLGIVAERFPKGGALSLNAVSAVGMMSVGVLGTVFLGSIQDHAVESRLHAENPALHRQVVATKSSVMGTYQAVDPDRVKALSETDQAALHKLTGDASKGALATTAIFPAMMLVGYLGLFFIFRTRGGYRAVALNNPAAGGPPPN